MSLGLVNYNLATKIVSHYSQLLIDQPTGERSWYGYSDLHGYDIVDISNAFKLKIAYWSYQAKFTKSATEKLQQHADECDSAIAIYDLSFIPDNYKIALDSLDINAPEYLVEAIKIESNAFARQASNTIKEDETVKSLLNYCLSIKQERYYWALVYTRLGLAVSTLDKFDPIYILMELEKGNKNLIKQVEAIASPVVSESLYRPVKPKVDNSTYWILIGLLAGSLYFPLLQRVTFFLLICLNIMIVAFKVKWKMIETRSDYLNMMVHLLTTLGLIYGLVSNNDAGFVAICYLILIVFQYMFSIRQTYLLKGTK